MTRDKIIKGLIRGYSCDDEDDCSLSCNDCIHQKFSDYEKQIRADAIEKLENILKDFFKKQNNPKSKFRPSIVMMEEDTLNILEQLKEQTDVESNSNRE